MIFGGGEDVLCIGGGKKAEVTAELVWSIYFVLYFSVLINKGIVIC